MASGLYIKDKNVSGFGVKGTNSTGYIGENQFFPDLIRYTYTLSNVRIEYSSGTSLLPDNSNNAVLVGTLTKKNGGSTVSTTTVPLTITDVGSDYVIVIDNSLYWNKRDYAKTVIPQTSANVKGYFINGNNREEYTATIICAPNRNDVILSSKIVEFTLDNSNPYKYKTYTTNPVAYVKAERELGYSSGEKNGTSTIEMKSLQVSISSSVEHQSQGTATDAVYTFVNNSSVDVKIKATLYTKCTWYDEQSGTTGYATDYDSDTFIVTAGSTYTTRNLRVDAAESITYPASHTEEFYYNIDDNTNKITVGGSYVGYVAKGADYFVFSTNAGSNAVFDKLTGQYTIKGGNLSGSSYYVMVKDASTTASKTCYLTNS